MDSLVQSNQSSMQKDHRETHDCHMQEHDMTHVKY